VLRKLQQISNDFGIPSASTSFVGCSQSDTKKSQASIAFAWLFTNEDQR